MIQRSEAIGLTVCKQVIVEEKTNNPPREGCLTLSHDRCAVDIATVRKIAAAVRLEYSNIGPPFFLSSQRRAFMSHYLLARGRLNRCLPAAVIPLCVGLLLSALTVTPLHAQPPIRFKAPEFDGAVGPTLGSDKPIKLKDLRGKIVILDFWTLC